MPANPPPPPVPDWSKDQHHDHTFRDARTIPSLAGKRFSGCRFVNCVFDGTDLTQTRFDECVFEDCALLMPTVNELQMTDTRFVGCKLTGIVFDRINTMLVSFEFERCLLVSSTFFRMDLSGYDFAKCRIQDCSFEYSLLCRASFQDVLFEKTVVTDCDLRNANFRGASGFMIDPTNCRLAGATFTHANAHELLRVFELNIV